MLLATSAGHFCSLRCQQGAAAGELGRGATAEAGAEGTAGASGAAGVRLGRTAWSRSCTHGRFAKVLARGGWISGSLKETESSSLENFGAEMFLGRARRRRGLGKSLVSPATRKKGFGKGEAKPKPKKEPSGQIETFELPDGTQGAAAEQPKESEEDFEERLRGIRRAAEQKKRQMQQREVAPIDYDSQPEAADASGSWTQNLGAKIGIGVFAVVFIAIFAFGDIFAGAPPLSSSATSTSSSSAAPSLSPDQVARLQAQADEFEAVLKSSPDDRDALEGAAVSLAQLGQLKKSEGYLERLTKVAAADVDVWRLLGEVRSAVGETKRSIDAYRQALELSPGVSVDLLSGLTAALIDDSRPAEAVDTLLSVRQQISSSGEEGPKFADGDAVQVDLLLGKAYLAWKKPGDALAVFDLLIAQHPEDFRPFLAKGLLLKDQGSVGDAERMFVQARYLAPEKAKAFVDHLSGRAS